MLARSNDSFCKRPDLKPDNILVSLAATGEDIERELMANPSETYEPRFDPSLPSEPIITVKSQKLPNFGLKADLSNLKIKVIDFECGKSNYSNAKLVIEIFLLMIF